MAVVAKVERLALRHRSCGYIQFDGLLDNLRILNFAPKFAVRKYSLSQRRRAALWSKVIAHDTDAKV
jgi:hypothetical protein